MATDEIDTRKEQPEYEISFAPIDEIRSIENILVNLETTRSELQKVAERMKPVES